MTAIDTAIETATWTTRSGLTLAGDAGGPRGAPAVVLLHGGGQTRHSWSGELERLAAAGYRAISYDARGHGDSSWAPDGDYSAAVMAEDLYTVLAGLNRPIALIGASMGGIAALHAVGNATSPIADVLILVDIVPRPTREGAARILAFMGANPEGFATLQDAADAVARYNPDRPRPANPEGLRRNLRQQDDGRFYWHWDPRLIAPAGGVQPSRLSDSALAVAPNVKLPTLLVRGGRSDVVDDAGVAELQSLIPQTEVFDVPAAGHMVAGDDNSAFHNGLFAFLQRHLPTKPR